MPSDGSTALGFPVPPALKEDEAARVHAVRRTALASWRASYAHAARRETDVHNSSRTLLASR
jgi:hypothetical protein